MYMYEWSHIVVPLHHTSNTYQARSQDSEGGGGGGGGGGSL